MRGVKHTTVKKIEAKTHSEIKQEEVALKILRDHALFMKRFSL